VKELKMTSSNEIQKFPIDTNLTLLGGDKPIISLFIIEYYDLKKGDLVKGFQDDCEWDGVVMYDDLCPEGKRWYLQLDLDSKQHVNIERMEGRNEGLDSGMALGEIRGEIHVVSAMLADGFDVNKIKKYTRLSMERINIMKKQTINIKETI
jgi:hypothetical protein